MKTGEYYAVIFTSQRSDSSSEDYKKMSEKMEQLARSQKGFLGIESARGEDGLGVTVSYWQSLQDIKNWKANSEHQVAQQKARSEFYSKFKVRICKVEREYEF